MVFPYVVSVVTGIAIGFMLVVNDTLVEFKTSPHNYPRMQRNESLRRHYVEALFTSILLWLGGAVYMLLHGDKLCILVAGAVAIVTKQSFDKYKKL